MREFINIISEEAAKADIEKVLRSNGYEDLKMSGNTIIVLAQIPTGTKKDQFRRAILNEILTIFKTQLPASSASYSTDPKLSSIGGIVFANSPIRVLVKDSGIQGDKSAGVANEIELASMIQSVIQKYGSATVTFVDPRGVKLTIENATVVSVAGRDVKGRKKADVVIASPTRNLPISIKKLNAEAWESADTLFGKKARNIILQLEKDGIVELRKLKQSTETRPVFELSKEIVIEPTEQEAMSAIFGSDINPAGGVVIQTFKPEHFVQDRNSITVNCHAVITSKDDIPESHLMVWLLRNDSSRNSKSLGIPGIRIMAVTLSRGIGRKGDKDVILVDKNGDVVQRNYQPATTDQTEPVQVKTNTKTRQAALRAQSETPRQKR